MIDRQWHYSDGQTPRGPVSTRQLVDLLRAGRLPATALVWTEGWPQWYPARDVAELATEAWPGGGSGAESPQPVSDVEPPPTATAPRRQDRGTVHSPRIAMIASALVPGAGQAYNGQPGRALLVLLSSWLLLPWIWGIWNAGSVAGRIAEGGGRPGRGGAGWVFIQAWTAANLALFTLLALTVGGWLQ